jgi:hypothetical protein
MWELYAMATSSQLPGESILEGTEGKLTREHQMDPVTVGAVLLAIISGSSEGLAAQLWEGVVALVHRPFQRQRASVEGSGPGASLGEGELDTLVQAPDEQRAIALAKVLLARATADEDFREALESWWSQAEPVRVVVRRVPNVNVINTICGGSQYGPVFQGSSFTGLTFNLSRPVRKPSE